MFPLSIGHSMALFAVFFHGSSSLYVKGAANRAAQAWTSTHPFLAADLHPLAFQVYFLLGVCLTSCFGLFAVHSIQFCPWAGASGFLLVLYESLGLCAVYYIGLSVSLAIISSIAILSAFFMGHLLFDNLLWSDSMTSVALTLMVLGIVGVCWCNELGSYWRCAEERSPILHTLELESAWVQASTLSRILGSLFAVCAGIAGSAMLLPWAFLDVSVWAFLPWFGLVALSSGVVACGIWVVLFDPEVQWWCSSTQQARAVVCCAVLSGIVWNAGNLFVMFAIKHIGYSLAYPIFHCQALVMVFWNLYLFQETREKTLGVYIVAGFLLITGGLLLSLVVHL